MKAQIKINNVSVKYPLRYADPQTIRGQILKAFTKKKHIITDTKKELFALDEISLQIHEGERVGIIGANGSGKTTLLKVLTEVLYPTSGNIKITGQVNAILDPGLGMDPEASGAENIRIRCMLLGIKSLEIDKKINDITEFSELGEAIRRPIKTYSTGMSMRLMFSIATAIAPDILVMDEWLSAGDIRFVAKALTKMQELIHSSRILVLATHSETVLLEWCNRVIWMKNGRIVADGTPANILADYKADAHLSSN